MGRAILHKVPPLIPARALLTIGACGASSALFACSWLLDWKSYTTDGGEGSSVPGADESAGGTNDSGAMNGSGGSTDAGAQDAGASDGVTSGDVAIDAESDGPTPCTPANCSGCCGPNGCYGGGTGDYCGTGGALCANCRDSGLSCIPDGGFCSSSTITTHPCTPSDASACHNRCIPILFPPGITVTTCCTSELTCGCKATSQFFPALVCQ